MFLIAGLGNPGGQYVTTRHNAGFLILDELAESQSARFGSSKFYGETASISLLGEKCLLLKPDTFMNLSGKAVQAAAAFYKLSADEIIIIHDDVDMPPMSVKAKKGGGHGGQNGVRDIIKCLGTDRFSRVKIGVGKPGPDDQIRDVADWVLAPFEDEELLQFQGPVLKEVSLRVEGLIRGAR
jgi:PTH1 family peptidyl-tRNA hydrolase